MNDISELAFQQINESIKLVFDLTSRIDERVKILVEHHNEANQRIEKLVGRQEDIVTRISILEAKGNGGIEKIRQARTVRHDDGDGEIQRSDHEASRRTHAAHGIDARDAIKKD